MSTIPGPAILQGLARRREDGSSHMASRMIRAARLVIHAAATAARGAPPLGIDLPPSWWMAPQRGRVPDIDESVRAFVPTAICLLPPPWPAIWGCQTDVDVADRPRFVSAVYVPAAHRRIGFQQAARAYLAPPALRDEVERRAELLAATGKGVLHGRRGVLAGRLTPSEAVHQAPLDEALALVPVLAATEGVTAAISPDASWPAASGFVQGVADRLGVRIVRLPLEGVPIHLRMHIRVVSYGERDTATARP